MCGWMNSPVLGTGGVLLWGVVSDLHKQKVALFIPVLQRQHFLNLLQEKVRALCLKKKSYGKHGNKKYSLRLMRESVPQQVASQLAQIKQNWSVETYQQSRRDNGQVVGPGADGEYLLRSSALLVKSPSNTVPSLGCEIHCHALWILVFCLFVCFFHFGMHLVQFPKILEYSFLKVFHRLAHFSGE